MKSLNCSKYNRAALVQLAVTSQCNVLAVPCLQGLAAPGGGREVAHGVVSGAGRDGAHGSSVSLGTGYELNQCTCIYDDLHVDWMP